jgi:hypothetical protein
MDGIRRPAAHDGRRCSAGGLRRAYWVPDARTQFTTCPNRPQPPSTGTAEGTSKPSADAHRAGACRAARTAAPDSRRAGCGRISPIAAHEGGRELRFEKLIAYAGVRESLREILFGLMLGAMVNLHVYDFPCEEPASWMKSRATWFV